MSYVLSTKQVPYSKRSHAVQAEVVVFHIMRNIKVLVHGYMNLERRKKNLGKEKMTDITNVLINLHIAFL